ncbi:tRNA (adenosine(37)-N6)-dimethylallyltransferase MiaA [Candidatus Schneideria nysicola]|nr:tRNA (adenosine(37)-N6)-dimethylallyltransferase MiaA [Candidatus Schneideria nysicola]
MIYKNINNTTIPLAIFLMGTTASNKTKLAIELFHKIKEIEIISVDSVKIYKGMDIGTAKLSHQERKVINPLLIDILDPSESYSVANFYHDALFEMKRITELGRIPLLVGGTLLYFKVLLEGLHSALPKKNIEIREYLKNKAKLRGWKKLYQYLEEIDPIIAKHIHPNDIQRLSRALEVFLISGKTVTELINTHPKFVLPYKVYQFIMVPSDRLHLQKRIENRFYKMLFNGFENEVYTLFTRGDLNQNMSSIRSIGYRQMWEYLSNEINYDFMVNSVISATKKFAKRQITWLKSWKEAYWLSNNDIEKNINEILSFLKKEKNWLVIFFLKLMPFKIYAAIFLY